MSKLRRFATLSLASLTALALAACAEGDPTTGATDDPGTGDDNGGTATQPFEVAEGVALEGSPTFDDMTANGVTIGVKEDQPGLGYLDPITEELSGFDVDIARWIAASLGFEESDITFQAIPSPNREQAIVNGDIDYYVGTYSITDERKQQIDFAGPYFITGQGLLVGVDSEVASEADLGPEPRCARSPARRPSRTSARTIQTSPLKSSTPTRSAWKPSSTTRSTWSPPTRPSSSATPRRTPSS